MLTCTGQGGRDENEQEVDGAEVFEQTEVRVGIPLPIGTMKPAAE
jgi:hypothetical protein